VTAIAVDPAGRLVLGGTMSSKAWAARLVSGKLDGGFGEASPSFGGSVAALSFGHGGIYVAGGTDASAHVVRLRDDGTPDPTFAPWSDSGNGLVASIATEDGVVVLDRSSRLRKLGTDGFETAGWSGTELFPSSVHASTLAFDTSRFLVAHDDPSSRIAFVDASGTAQGFGDAVAMGVRAIGLACDRIVLAGDGRVGLLGLDGHPVHADPGIATYSIGYGYDSVTRAAVQQDGRVLFAAGLPLEWPRAIAVARVIP
jgi:hypothetical protein